MPDKKLTDNEIKKALECCITYKQLCPMICPMHNDSHCLPKLKEYALDLIDRLQAENEELKSAINGFRGYEDKIKAEAYKELETRLEERIMLYPAAHRAMFACRKGNDDL